MKKLLDKPTIMAVVGFSAGYYLGRRYEIGFGVVFKKVDK